MKHLSLWPCIIGIAEVVPQPQGLCSGWTDLHGFASRQTWQVLSGELFFYVQYYLSYF